MTNIITTASLSAAFLESDATSVNSSNNNQASSAGKKEIVRDMIIKRGFSPEDRNQHIVSHLRMVWMASAIVLFVVLITVGSMLYWQVLKYAAIPTSLVLMGMWTILLIATSTGILNKPLQLLFLIISGFYVAISAIDSALDLVRSWPMFSGLALVVVMLQVTWLVATIWSGPPAETDAQESFFGSLNVICATVTLISMWFTFTSVLAWPSSLSFESAVASYFCLAYAAFIGSKITDGRGKCVDTFVICSSYAVPAYMETRNGWLAAALLLAGNVIASIAFVAWWPPDARDASQWIMGGCIIPAYFGTKAIVYESKLLRARRFYFRSDGAILVETFNKTYIYYKVLHASLEDGTGSDDLPRQTDKCHVYCARKSVPRVVVELTKERWLYLAPEAPKEFVDALVQFTTMNSKA